MSRIVLGFSGGVDSAVSAMLLKNAGHEVIGLYMDNTDENALRDAVETAEFAGIELEVADVRAALEENVCRPFTDCYLRGETPNPCVICNPSVKFKTLLAAADRRGAELVATGHYARAENGAIYKGRPPCSRWGSLKRRRRAPWRRSSGFPSRTRATAWRYASFRTRIT